MTVFLSSALHVAIYAALRLVFILHDAVTNASAFLRAHVADRLQKQARNNRAALNLDTPRHIAFSGALAEHLPLLVDHIHTLLRSGTQHFTLHDASFRIDPDRLQHLLQSNRNRQQYTLTELSAKRTTTKQVHTHAPKTQPNAQHTTIITVVHPACGPSLLTRATKHLISSPAFQTASLNAQTVTEWLDKDPQNCMLPSEPDLLFIFPSSASTFLPVLNRFPVWQLRLTQLIFLPYPVSKLTTQQLLKTAINASKAPKRFGR
ncbi:hypothetical protein BWQ96_04947 [Gracilariopsis chorda]|uniref:Ditrans,polycis-polyprenyl diphosphate synthase ((2E,6E)-farnesyl diphosphate specific) n=1 Tax=Gracilariopsis chorda TaxID=448386 RepID=A0A2V3IT58_9FLOR|nr:hypothetical protein BWQ96_04947 [Gracilariopsis chorda]|eukprot:PXF45306.1 hypothetical protein BWQ96_04947 [Gracilariopsis chorda]